MRTFQLLYNSEHIISASEFSIEEIEIFGISEGDSSGAIGNALAKDIQSMNGAERKKYFEGMKKEKLVLKDRMTEIIHRHK